MKRKIAIMFFISLFLVNGFSSNISIKAESMSKVESIWFVGAIKDTLKIHIKISKSGDSASGIYYYDKYKKNISLQGEFQNRTFSVDEVGSKGTIEGLFINDELIEGIWTDGKNTYPMYAIKEGSKEKIPKKPDNNIMALSGDWKGVKSNYYECTNLILTPVFINLIKFDFEAFSGTHSGALSSVALVKNGIVQFSGIEQVHYNFSIKKDGNLKVDSNDYTYYCGAGVAFDSLYTKKPLNIKPPTLKQIGVFTTDKEEEIFKKLTGKHYSDFIQYGQRCYELDNLDGNDFKAFSMGVLGYMNAGIIAYRHKDNTIWAVIDGGDSLYYFTNDKKTTEQPKTLKNWLENKDPSLIIKNIK